MDDINDELLVFRRLDHTPQNVTFSRKSIVKRRVLEDCVGTDQDIGFVDSYGEFLVLLAIVEHADLPRAVQHLLQGPLAFDFFKTNNVGRDVAQNALDVRNPGRIGAFAEPLKVVRR